MFVATSASGIYACAFKFEVRLNPVTAGLHRTVLKFGIDIRIENGVKCNEYTVVQLVIKAYPKMCYLVATLGHHWLLCMVIYSF